MSALRFVGLFLTALSLTVVAASAQVQPPIKPPAPKPGDPPKKPPGKPGDPKNPPGKGDPKLPPIVIAPPGAKQPAKKKDETKWPDKVNGKTVDVIVKEMKASPDPGVREAAVRALPQFGPKGRDAGGDDLVEVMTKDPDWSVRLAALHVAPTVLFGYLALTEGMPDKALFDGLNAMINALNSSHMNVRYEALAAVASIGPYIRIASNNKVVPVIVSRCKEPTSWHIRRAGAACLGQVGVGMPKDEETEDRFYPDQPSVDALLDILRNDQCSAVRREALNSLVLLGTVQPSEQKRWRAALDAVLARDKDKAVQLWARVAILANDPAGVKGNEAHMNAVAVVLQAPEAAGRLEACQAFALLGDDASGKLQELLNLVQKKDEEPAVVAAGLMALASMKSQAKITLPTVEQIKMNHPNAEVKRVAGEASEILRGLKKKD
jgi:HEAT repeat protein